MPLFPFTEEETKAPRGLKTLRARTDSSLPDSRTPVFLLQDLGLRLREKKKKQGSISLAVQWLRLHPSGHGFDPWLQNESPCAERSGQKRKKKSNDLGLRLAGITMMLVIRFQAEVGGIYLLSGGVCCASSLDRRSHKQLAPNPGVLGEWHRHGDMDTADGG